MSFEHCCILPIKCVNFLNCSMQQRASIGEKCFESSKHSGDLKKMKRRLGEAVEYYINYQPKGAESPRGAYIGEGIYQLPAEGAESPRGAYIGEGILIKSGTCV